MLLSGKRILVAFMVTLTSAAGAAAAAEPQIDKTAEVLLRTMSAKLAGAKTLRLNVTRTLDAGLIEGIDRSETIQGEVLLQRPNKLAVRITKGRRRRLVYDGARVSILDVEANCYATVDAPADIDGMLKMLEEEHGYTPPLADFLRSDPYGHFMQQVKEAGEEFQSGKYAGIEVVGGVPLHHLAFREQYVHWDIWIDTRTGLPKRFVAKATGIKGHPGLALEFRSIDLAPRLDAKSFVFAAPKGAEAIPMAKVERPKLADSQTQHSGKAAGHLGSIRAATMKMTTQIPHQIMTPDKVNTPIGTLEYFDGVPTKPTVEAVYDYVDRARAVEVFINLIPAVSMYHIREGQRDMGATACNQILIWEQLGDSRSLVLTYNNTSLYTWGFLDLKKDGPTVIEIPPDVLGILDDMYFRYISDMGAAGPDKGKGGKYLVLPPGYKGRVPKGYFVVKSKTYCVWNFMRGYVRGSVKNPADVKRAADNVKNNLKVYPLAKRNNPPKMVFVNMSGKYYNTIPPNDFSFYESLNQIIQEEPLDFIDAETRGLIASIGIVKGKVFNPDGRMRRILTEAVAIGNAYARANTVFPRDPGHRFYPETNSEWVMAFADKDSFFLKDGARRMDSRLWMHYNAVCVTPAMALTRPGAGSDYGIAGLDAEHRPLDGAKTYKLHLPPNVPVKDNWSVTIYDPQTRCMLQTDQPRAGLNSLSGAVKKNPDGSIDLYFAPKAPKGKESNWIQTIPGKSWFIILRMYGPLQPWLDKTWRPGELELMK